MIELIDEKNASHLEIMIQDYEEEFSHVTGKEPNEQGQFELDVDWRAPNVAFYWVEGDARVGFCVHHIVDGRSDVGEFYIKPSYRRAKVGERFAFALFDHFKGPWQVRQIEGADVARAFWRNVIAKYTDGNYVELILDDPHWGRVICQRFAL